VKVFKHHAQILADWLIHNESDVPGIKSVTVWHIIVAAVEARNSSVTYGGVTPLEIAFGRKPPDVIDLETMNPGQMSQEDTQIVKRDREVKKLAIQAHQEARQREDIRRDLAQRIRSHSGPYQPGEGVWYWDRDQNKIRGGEWRKAKIVSVGKPPMVTIDIGGRMTLTNISKIRKNPDPWHDVVIPGLDGRDGTVTVPGLGADREDPDATPPGRDVADHPPGLRPAQGSRDDILFVDENRAPTMVFTWEDVSFNRCALRMKS